MAEIRNQTKSQEGCINNHITDLKMEMEDFDRNTFNPKSNSAGTLEVDCAEIQKMRKSHSEKCIPATDLDIGIDELESAVEDKPSTLNQFEVLSFYLNNNLISTWKEICDWATSNGYEINHIKQIHIDLMKENILCQKQKIGQELINGNGLVYNFSINNAYFWINPNLDLETKLIQIKQQLVNTTSTKRRKLKSKQTYLSSQSKCLDDKIKGHAQTITQAQLELDEIREQIDILYEQKITHEQANRETMIELEAQVNVLLSKQAELTDCIYGIVQYILEQSTKQKTMKKYNGKKSSEPSEDSEEITFADISNYFPYLQNLEQEVVDPDDFCEFQIQMEDYGQREAEQCSQEMLVHTQNKLEVNSQISQGSWLSNGSEIKSEKASPCKNGHIMSIQSQSSIKSKPGTPSSILRLSSRLGQGRGLPFIKPSPQKLSDSSRFLASSGVPLAIGQAKII